MVPPSWREISGLPSVTVFTEVPPTVIGGAMLPHAPQFFTMPKTEDRATVERVKAVAREIGEQLKALKPDLWLIIANDHAEQFFHNVCPAFTVHVGGEARGQFVGRDFHWRVPGETGFAIVRELYRQGFDPAFSSTAKIDYAMGIPLTHLGVEDPVLPISVNAYLPPQPTIERCYAFGEALARVVTALGLRTAVIASGGMSHYPGTERYAEPDLAWDEAALARLAAGNLKSLIGYSEEELDRAGNIELRCWGRWPVSGTPRDDETRRGKHSTAAISQQRSRGLANRTARNRREFSPSFLNFSAGS
jgi:2,3-dihydroxyphenylpropionate 1,2-dioxygenase